MKEFSLTSGEVTVKLPRGGTATVKYYTRALIYTIDNEIAQAAIEQLRKQATDDAD